MTLGSSQFHIPANVITLTLP